MGSDHADMTGFSIAKSRGRLIGDGGRSLRVANLSEGLIARDNVNQIVLGGLARHKKSTIKGTERWHQTLYPLKPAATALDAKSTECEHALVFQTSICNLRCWFCFVDYHLLAGLPATTGMLQAELVASYVEEKGIRIIHASGGESMLVPEYAKALLECTQHQDLASRPYVWIETNLTIAPSMLPSTSRQSLKYLGSSTRCGVVGCFRSITSEDYQYASGSNMNWLTQFATAKELLEHELDCYFTVILMLCETRDVRGKVRRFLDTAIEHLGEVSIAKTVPIEVKPYSAVAARLNPIAARVMESQYEVLSVYWEELAKYLGESPFGVLPIRSTTSSLVD